MKMEIEIPMGYKAEWVNGVLTLIKDKKEDSRLVTERVKTFEDAVADIAAYLKLRIITAALNEGWTPQFTDNGYRYYPLFELHNKKDWDDHFENLKRERGILLSGNSNDGAYAGFVNAYSFRTSLLTYATLSSHLCFKNKELALYAGKQFASLWLDFCYLPNIECKPYCNE